MRCEECRVHAVGRAEGCRAYRVDADAKDEREILIYCPACAEREFGMHPNDEGTSTAPS